jgi:hypothetical protein
MLGISFPAMAPTEFHAALGSLNVAQQRVAQLFAVSPRAVRRWRDGERRVPRGVNIVIHLLAAGVVTIDQVERAAGPISAQMNGGASSDPPVEELPSEFVFAEPVLEQFSLVNEAVTFADAAATFVDPVMAPPGCSCKQTDHEAEPGAEAAVLTELDPQPSAPLAEPVTTAEKVAALSSAVCHWPCGDPRHSDFRFCGSPVEAPPYCAEHRAAAYMVLPLQPARRRRCRLYTSARGIAWAG